jgi:hypothetical protein
MESATASSGCTNPLPLFRPEAVAARQALQGEVLGIRPLSWICFVSLIGLIILSALGLLFFSHFEFTTTVSGVVSPVAASPKAPNTEATFYIPQRWTHDLHPGISVLVHCAHCTGRALTGVVSAIDPVPVSTDMARPGTVFKVTLALSLPQSKSAGAEQFRPGTKLEAEFPVERRPLIRAFIGAGAW